MTSWLDDFSIGDNLTNDRWTRGLWYFFKYLLNYKIEENIRVSTTVRIQLLCLRWIKNSFACFSTKKANPGLFIFILFSFKFQWYKLNKSIGGVLGIRTQDYRIVGADETTKLWRPSNSFTYLVKSKQVKQEARITVILPPMVRVFSTSHLN